MVGNLLDAIEIGIPLPSVLISEMQNGDFLVLEAKEQLQCLLLFLCGEIDMIRNKEYETKEYSFDDLDNQNPRLSSRIMRNVISFQIIEYRNPRYLHMQVGKFLEDWTISKEFSVREKVYEKEKMYILDEFVKMIFERAIFSRNARNVRKNELLYMMAYFLTLKGEIEVSGQLAVNEQFILDQTIKLLDEMKDKYCDEFVFYARRAYEWYSSHRQFNGRLISTYRPEKSKILGILICTVAMHKDSERMFYERDSFLGDIMNESGSYINIGKISELKNKYVGSKEIEIVVNKNISKKMIDDNSDIVYEGDLSSEINVIYLSADRIGVRDTYETALDNHDKIGIKCEYAYQYLAIHDPD